MSMYEYNKIDNISLLEEIKLWSVISAVYDT
jgi:hypothetical protein